MGVVISVVAGKWNAEALASALEDVDVSPLLVAADPGDSRRLTVYLHGPAGLGQQERAIAHLRELEGIEGVDVSDYAWTILRVDVVSG